MLFAAGSWRRWVSFPVASALGMVAVWSFAARPASAAVELPPCKTGPSASRPADVYVPMDSWMYPAMDRLHGLGFADSAYLGLRPWTRRGMQRVIEESSQDPDLPGNAQAQEIVTAIERELGDEAADDEGDFFYGCEGLYTRMQGIAGLTLRDSFHLGQTIANDYGRPYQPGFNTVDGAAGSVEYGRFSLYARGEYQHAPGAAGYSPSLVATLSNIDDVPLATNPVQATIPAGPIASTDVLRIMEANLLLPNPQPRDFVRQERPLVCAYGGWRVYVQQQCGKHLCVSDRPHGAALYSAAVAAYRRLPLRVFCGQPEGAYRPERSLDACGEDQLQAYGQH